MQQLHDMHRACTVSVTPSVWGLRLTKKNTCVEGQGCLQPSALCLVLPLYGEYKSEQKHTTSSFCFLSTWHTRVKVCSQEKLSNVQGRIRTARLAGNTGTVQEAGFCLTTQGRGGG